MVYLCFACLHARKAASPTSQITSVSEFKFKDWGLRDPLLEPLKGSGVGYQWRGDTWLNVLSSVHGVDRAWERQCLKDQHFGVPFFFLFGYKPASPQSTTSALICDFQAFRFTWLFRIRSCAKQETTWKGRKGHVWKCSLASFTRVSFGGSHSAASASQVLLFLWAAKAAPELAPSNRKHASLAGAPADNGFPVEQKTRALINIAFNPFTATWAALRKKRAEGKNHLS